MKKFEDAINRAETDQSTTGVKSFWKKCTDKAKCSEFRCPFCRDEFKGLSALLSHLKSHCT